MSSSSLKSLHIICPRYFTLSDSEITTPFTMKEGHTACLMALFLHIKTVLFLELYTTSWLPGFARVPSLLTSLHPSVPPSLLHSSPSIPSSPFLIPTPSYISSLPPPSFLPSSSLTPTLVLPCASPPSSLLPSSSLLPPSSLPAPLSLHSSALPPSLRPLLPHSLPLPPSLPTIPPSIPPPLSSLLHPPSLPPFLIPTPTYIPSLPPPFLPASALPAPLLRP